MRHKAKNKDDLNKITTRLNKVGTGTKASQSNFVRFEGVSILLLVYECGHSIKQTYAELKPRV